MENHNCLKSECGQYTPQDFHKPAPIYILKNLKDYLIIHFQSLLLLEPSPNSKLEKYWLRFLYILLKYGSLAVLKKGNEIIYGKIKLDTFDRNGDIDNFLIESIKPAKKTVHPTKEFINDIIFCNLSNFKPIFKNHSNIAGQVEESFENIRINQWNTSIKYYIMNNSTEEGHYQITVKPARNYMGIAVVEKSLIPNQKSENETKNDNSNNNGANADDWLSDNKLITNDYKNDNEESWKNFKSSWDFWCLLNGIRENRVTKMAQLTKDEAKNQDFTFEIKENFWYMKVKKFVNDWNKLFDEDNKVARAYIEQGSGQDESNPIVE